MKKSLPIAHHVTTRLEEDRALAPTPRGRRIFARVVLELGRNAGLLAFCVADTHLHLLLLLARAAAQELMRRVEIALQLRLRFGSPFERARPRPIYNLWHLAHSLRYVHTQEERHGLVGFDSGEATSLPDLLEMRPLGSYLIPRVRRHLPRLTRDELLGHVGRQDLEPAQGPPSLVLDAACRAAALPGSMRERARSHRRPPRCPGGDAGPARPGGGRQAPGPFPRHGLPACGPPSGPCPGAGYRASARLARGGEPNPGSHGVRLLSPRTQGEWGVVGRWTVAEWAPGPGRVSAWTVAEWGAMDRGSGTWARRGAHGPWRSGHLGQGE